ncbi:unnamed protein product [Adineta steineri]|uniref:Uncharacterized protein n=1 Tax=Adineta steineri TaxID=433720 RepID=A0A819K6E5_9BILA|nr:unnamed protein product [Adineta steineri]CAF3943117.1 unnamed protein product [Adineta steineri]
MFIGAHADLAYDVAYPERFLKLNEDHNAVDSIHYMAKRRFLPTRRELHRYINNEDSNESDDEESHLNTKRYFLKSKRYFLNSK